MEKLKGNREKIAPHDSRRRQCFLWALVRRGLSESVWIDIEHDGFQSCFRNRHGINGTLMMYSMSAIKDFWLRSRVCTKGTIQLEAVIDVDEVKKSEHVVASGGDLVVSK